MARVNSTKSFKRPKKTHTKSARRNTKITTRVNVRVALRPKKLTSRVRTSFSAVWLRSFREFDRSDQLQSWSLSCIISFDKVTGGEAAMKQQYYKASCEMATCSYEGRFKAKDLEEA